MPPSQDEFEARWTELNRAQHRLTLWVAATPALPGGVLAVSFLLPAVPEHSFVVVGILCVAATMRALAHLVSVPCPRCNRSFSWDGFQLTGRLGIESPIRETCVHCGLRAGTPSSDAT